MNTTEALSNNKTHTEGVNMPLSQLIRETRISLNLSQRTFAKRLDITQAQLSRLENGTARKPNRRTLQALLPYFDMLSYEDLLAMAGYSVDLTEEKENLEDSSSISSDVENSSDEFEDLKPEWCNALKEVQKYLEEPKNLILLQKILALIKQIGESGDSMDNETMKKRYLRDCVINILQ